MSGKTIKGITIEFAGETVKLGKALKEIEAYGKDIEKQLKQVDSALKLDPDSTDLLTQKQRVLGDQIENTSQRLEALKAAQEAAAKSLGNYDAYIAVFEPLQKEIDNTKKKITELTAQQKKMERAGKIDTEAYVNLSAEIDSLKDNLKDLTDESKRVKEEFGDPISTQEWNKLQLEIAATEAKLQNAQKEVQNVSDKLKAIDSSPLKEIASSLEENERKCGSLGKELKEVNNLLKFDDSNVTLLEQKQELLTEAIEETSKSIEKMEDAYDKMLSECDNGIPKNKDEFRKLERQIEAAKQELNKLTSEAQQTRNKIDGIDEKPVDEVADAAGKAADALERASNKASTFGDVLKAEAIVEGAKGILNWAKGTAESTQEYRNNMAQLEVSSEAAGYSAEQTREAYYSLYGVLGDEQSAMTAVANLQALQLPQEQLMALIDNVIGAWVKYGDSIPIESLAESINETVKTGEVVGTLADVLNWGSAEGERFGVVTKQNTDAQKELSTAAQEFTRNSQGYIDALWEGIDAQSNDISSAREAVDVRTAESAAMESLAEKTEKVTVKKKEASDANEEYNKTVEAATTAEEFFNIALSDRNSETERASFLLETLVNQGLSNMAQKLRENNASMIEANQASADWQEQLAILGEEIEPLLTDLLEMVTKFLKGFNELDPGTQKLIISLTGLVAVIGPLGNAFDGASKIIGLFSKDGLSGLISKLGILSGDTLPEVTTTFDKAANKWVMTLDTSTEAITGGILPSLQTAFTTVFGFIKAHPIAALITAIAFFGDDIQNILQGVDDFLQQIFVKDWTQVFGPILGGLLNEFLNRVKNVWDGIKQILDGVIDFIRGVFTGDWERAWRGVVGIFQGIFDGLAEILRWPINQVIGLVNDAIDAINGLIEGANLIPGVNLQTIGYIPLLQSKSEREAPITGLEWTQDEINRIIENDHEYMVSLLDNDRRSNRAENRSNYKSMNFNGDINVYAAEGQNERDIAAFVLEEAQRLVEQEEAGLSGGY